MAEIGTRKRITWIPKEEPATTPQKEPVREPEREPVPA